MKSLIINLAIIVLLQPGVAKSQTSIDRLYEKYAGQKGFTSININPDMFRMIATMDMNDSSEQAKEAQNAMQELSGLKMLVYEPEEGETNEDFMDDVRALTKIKGYSEMMSVKDGNEVVKFLAKEGKDGKIPEMLMIVLEDDEVVVMSMTGNMSMETFAKISKSLGMSGLDKTDK